MAETARKRIVITNDDGVHAPGIMALTEAMRTLADVEVIAPLVNQSASGHKKTLHQDIPVTRTTLADGTPALAVGSAPADCIALGALGLLTWPPDLVVSGINRGANMGQDITYSGTVTAALEACIHGVPAVAVSLDNQQANDLADYREAARVAIEVVRRALVNPLPPLTILNVNVPRVEHSKGLRLTRQGIRIYRDALVQNGDLYQMTGPEPTGEHQEVATDIWAVHLGYASLTPIHLDMTAHRFMAELATWDIRL